MALSMHTTAIDSETVNEAKLLPIQKSATKTITADSKIDNKNRVAADLTWTKNRFNAGEMIWMPPSNDPNMMTILDFIIPLSGQSKE